MRWEEESVFPSVASPSSMEKMSTAYSSRPVYFSKPIGGKGQKGFFHPMVFEKETRGTQLASQLANADAEAAEPKRRSERLVNKPAPPKAEPKPKKEKAVPKLKKAKEVKKAAPEEKEAPAENGEAKAEEGEPATEEPEQKEDAAE